MGQPLNKTTSITGIAIAVFALGAIGLLHSAAVPVESAFDFSATASSAIPVSPENEAATDSIASNPITDESGTTNGAVIELTPEDQVTLSSLPPVCTSELPGLDRSADEPLIVSLPEFAVVEHAAIQIAEVIAEDQPAIAQVAWEQPQVVSEQPHVAEPIATAIESPAVTAQPVSFAPALTGMPNPHTGSSAKSASTKKSAYDIDPHLEIYSRTPFPSAADCATCHEQIYDEWATSSHAYAAISPMFHKFESKINKLTSGTIGYFCLRCHAPVATTMGLRRDQAIWDGPRVFREGVTCVACHRVKTPYGKVDGERRIEPGALSDPVYGGSDGTGVATVKKYSDFFKVKTNTNADDKTPGQIMHRRSIQFEELSESTFCMSCHQVAVKPGIKLEVVWDQYRASPAYREGVTCQDCHTGIVPGRDEGYSVGPAAVVNDKVVNPERKHSNHTFYGPGYSIAHPGVFPDNRDADRWSVNQWLEFDWRAGWGTEQFEDAIDGGQYPMAFPQVWSNVDDRMDAREIVDANLKKLEYKRDLRRQLLENGSKLDGPFFTESPRIGDPLHVRFCLTNTNPGHNMPSGSLGAQPQLWMNCVLIDPAGNRIWESGYLDSNGDLADQHSLDVLARIVPLDTQLMNLQTKFLTQSVKGADREMYLPVNFDIDQLPFIRPAPQPVSVLNHPPGIRMEAHSIPPLGSRNVKYSIPSRLMTLPGTYQLSVRMRSRAEPIYFMRFCDSTPEMERMMNEWICDFHVQTVAFEVY